MIAFMLQKGFVRMFVSTPGLRPTPLRQGPTGTFLRSMQLISVYLSSVPITIGSWCGTGKPGQTTELEAFPNLRDSGGVYSLFVIYFFGVHGLAVSGSVLPNFDQQKVGAIPRHERDELM